MPHPDLPIIAPGKRATLAGRTGSGKSTLACWLLNRSPLHWCILNPKHTGAYSALPDANVVTTMRHSDIERSLANHRFTIVNPPGRESGHDYLDALVEYLHESYSELGLCADELYTLHNSGRPGPGLTGWLTRGRELKQSFLGLTQRPAWVSQFVFSEADFVGELDLLLLRDRKALYEITGQEPMLGRLEPRKWFWYDVGRDRLRYFGPVPQLTNQGARA